MLQCDQLELRQGDFELRADLVFEKGAITALVGPSGAGKSTLLSALAGFLVPVSGRVLCEGADLTMISPGKRPISTLFQDNNLFPHLTAMQNVGLALGGGLRLSADGRKNVLDVLRRVGLDGLAQRHPAELSGGQQSRAALARVLLADRPVILLDEPFAALGPGLKAEMLDLVKTVLSDAGRTVIMVTHDPADAKRVADDVVLIADGRATGPTATVQIFQNPPPALAQYLGES